jgi:hypothetical protein
MKKIDLGQGLTILANVGVIVGIGFLALQIRNDAAQGGMEAVQSMESSFIDWQLSIAKDPVMAEIYANGLDDYDSLPDRDKVRFDMLIRSRLRTVYAGIRARDRVFGSGSLGPPQERVLEANYIQLLERRGFRQWWATADLRDQPGREMLEQMDRISGSRSSSN